MANYPTGEKVKIQLHTKELNLDGLLCLGWACSDGLIEITTIDITNEFEFTQYYKRTVIHELGHAIDNCLEGACVEDIMTLGIYEKEKEMYIEPCFTLEFKLGNKKVTESATEFWAGIYTSYLLELQSLKEYCPESYAYLQNLFDLYQVE